MVPFSPDLLDALETSTVEHIRGEVWRQVLHPTSVLRSNLRGGRWNEPNTETLYCSLDPTTATAEIDALIVAQPIPITRPRLTYKLAIEASQVADLRPEPLGGLFDYRFDINDVPACQLIGGAAAWLGLGGLLTPSVRSDGDNLVLYVTNQDPDDLLQVLESYPYPPGPPGDEDWSRIVSR